MGSFHGSPGRPCDFIPREVRGQAAKSHHFSPTLVPEGEAPGLGPEGALQVDLLQGAPLALVSSLSPHSTFLAHFPESFAPSLPLWMVAMAVTLPVLTLILFTSGSICLVKKHHRKKSILSAEKDVEYEEKETARKELGKRGGTQRVKE